MPTVDQILSGLKEIANTWRAVSIFWHVYFAAIVVVLVVGIRPSRRVAGLLLGLPILSVSIIASVSSNPFNGVIFAVVGILLLFVSAKLQRDKVQIGPQWALIPGALMFTFGWIYPHFLDTSSYLPYLYSAPTGLIPCPTLSIVIGLALALNGLGSRAFLAILGIVGLFYGITGVAQLGVAVDWVLLLGAVTTTISAFARRKSVFADKAVTRS